MAICYGSHRQLVYCWALLGYTRVSSSLLALSLDVPPCLPLSNACSPEGMGPDEPLRRVWCQPGGIDYNLQFEVV